MMVNVSKLITTIHMGDDTQVEVQISYWLEVDEYGQLGWSYEIDKVRSVTMGGDDITEMVKADKLVLETLTTLAGDNKEQIIDAIEAEQAERREAA